MVKCTLHCAVEARRYDRPTPPTSVAQAPRPAGLRLGERLRQLRVAAGLTQSELAGERFSKEYVSQIERGKTRPTARDDRLARLRLGVDAGFLANGVSTDERGRVEATLTRAEALSRRTGTRRPSPSSSGFAPDVAATGLPSSRSGSSPARPGADAPRRAHAPRSSCSTGAHDLQRSRFSELERAEMLFRLGVCRYQLTSISTAIGLFNEALALAERSGLPSDLLRSNILSWRSRC